MELALVYVGGAAVVLVGMLYLTVRLSVCYAAVFWFAMIVGWIINLTVFILIVSFLAAMISGD